MSRSTRGVGTLLALMVVCASVAVGTSSQALASHGQITFFDSPHDLLSAVTRSKAIAQLQVLGVRALRVELHWHDVAPSPNSRKRPAFDATDPAAYRWGQYDALMAEAERLKWRVLLTVTSPVPRWASAGRDLLTRPSDRLFGQFMTAVGRHYGRQVSLWGIWNEPNLSGWLRPQFNPDGSPASPRIYRGLFEAAYVGLTAARIHSPKVLMGETAPFGSERSLGGGAGVPQEVAPLTFLRGALCLDGAYRRASTCAKLQVYGWAHHPYTYSAIRGPLYRPPEPDDVTIGTLSRLSRALDRAARAGAIAAHTPIYLSEFGIQGKPNVLGVSPTRQVEYDAISEKLAWDNPRVAAFSQYLLSDESSHGRFSGFRTGLETPTGELKPLYRGFPLPLVVSRQGRGFSLWGLVRPADGPTRVRVLERGSGSKRFRTLKVVQTDGRGYWTLRSSTRNVEWRVSWRGPTGIVYMGPPIPAS